MLRQRKAHDFLGWRLTRSGSRAAQHDSDGSNQGNPIHNQLRLEAEADYARASLLPMKFFTQPRPSRPTTFAGRAVPLARPVPSDVPIETVPLGNRAVGERTFAQLGYAPTAGSLIYAPLPQIVYGLVRRHKLSRWLAMTWSSLAKHAT